MKTARLDVRITEEQKNNYQYAASLSNYSSLTEFVVAAIDQFSEKVIREHEIMELTKRDREIFVEALLNPPEPNEKLRKAAEKYQKSME